jgi:pimeloyl-ACP methyl ester carboxylesterase
VPFDLLGDNAKGWLQTEYITPKLRLSRGNKGSLFVLVPEPEPDDPELEALLDPQPSLPPIERASLTKDPVLICPAQFGTLADYKELVNTLEAKGHPTVVTPLKFTDWLRLIPASLTPEYWKGELSPDVALPFYYEAIEKGVSQLQQEYPGKKIQLVAHSIGGWIARAYLGQISDEDRAAKFSALVTLGTPHRPPPDGIFKTLDQTRGLLKYVEERYPGAYHKELRYLTVGSTLQKGALPGKGEGLIAGTLAFASYLPLCGDGYTTGDGITPIKCAHLDGAEQREVDAYHIDFVPGNGARLLGTPWYGSPHIADAWTDFLQ